MRVRTPLFVSNWTDIILQTADVCFRLLYNLQHKVSINTSNSSIYDALLDPICAIVYHAPVTFSLWQRRFHLCFNNNNIRRNSAVADKPRDACV